MKKKSAFYIFSALLLLTSGAGFTLKTSFAQEISRLDVLDLKNMDANDVIKLISQKSGLNIVAGSNVNGKVTIYLKDVDVLEALGIIVDAYGWAFVKEGNIIKVMTAQDYETKYGSKFGQEAVTQIFQLAHASPTDLLGVLNQVKTTNGKIIADEKSKTIIAIDSSIKLMEMQNIVAKLDVLVENKVYHLMYAKAEDLSGKIAEILTPNLGQIRFDSRSNSLVVSDTQAKLVKVDSVVEAFDQKDTQVLIEAKIVQVTLSDQFKLGIDWEVIVADYHNLNFASNFDLLNPTDKKGHIGIGTLSSDDYTAALDALETVGITNILSSPSITAVNNQEAKILVGSTEPYVTTTTTTPASGPTTTAESINFIDVGVKLFVTPTIHKDGFVTMKIKPEVSSVVSNITTGTNNVIPVVETSQAETTVMVKDNITIVIGGLIKEEKLKTTKKVPFLGDIPFLGVAFKSKDDLVKKTEIVIFLTPRIMTGDVDEMSDETYQRMIP